MALQRTGPSGTKTLPPGYSYVEKFVGVSGNKDGLPMLPDGEFLPPLELTCVEDYFKAFVKKTYKDRHVIYGRCAHLTQPTALHLQQGRGQCQNRTLCQRGCPFGGYYNSNSTTIPWAERTGNMTLRPFSVVESIIYDDKKGKAAGVRIIDANTRETIEYCAPVIFVNAGALNTNLVLHQFYFAPLPPWPRQRQRPAGQIRRLSQLQRPYFRRIPRIYRSDHRRPPPDRRLYPPIP